MTKPTKERVEELAVLVKRAYVGSKCRDKNWRDLLAILDDCAERIDTKETKAGGVAHKPSMPSQDGELSVPGDRRLVRPGHTHSPGPTDADERQEQMWKFLMKVFRGASGVALTDEDRDCVSTISRLLVSVESGEER